jgi:hypothetical protein
MRWWRIRKRNADLEQELQSDLELEGVEQQERGQFAIADDSKLMRSI